MEVKEKSLVTNVFIGYTFILILATAIVTAFVLYDQNVALRKTIDEYNQPRYIELQAERDLYRKTLADIQTKGACFKAGVRQANLYASNPDTVDGWERCVIEKALADFYEFTDIIVNDIHRVLPKERLVIY